MKHRLFRVAYLGLLHCDRASLLNTGDSKLRGCDLSRLKIDDLCVG